MNSPENGSRAWVSPLITDPRTSQMLQFRRFTDSVPPPELQNYRFGHNVDYFSLPLMVALLLSRNLQFKAQGDFEKMWKSEQILRNQVPGIYCFKTTLASHNSSIQTLSSM